ncbi:alcohol dehydrogenase catalytic domain-containing protein [Rubrobacter marinus]|uniref:alcohol dehydrogenase catalytic domain-containing protein n=1 Tax=Rubrobacter marinus TaxID=2653852 RepID=UPI001A9E7399|nr:alcohol dehydrogenase catalytic domain-containing protein [Rubrobacter marinus]
MEPGKIPGHEGVGVVEEAGPDEKDLRPDDRVVVPSAPGRGFCAYDQGRARARRGLSREAGRFA